MNFMINLLRLSLTDPNAAGTHISALRPSFGTALSAFVVTIITAVVLIFALNGFETAVILPGFPEISPVSLAAIMGLGTLGLVGSIWLVAHAFGGSGSFPNGILIFAFEIIETLGSVLKCV